MLTKSVLLIVFLGLVGFSSAAPVKDAEAEVPIDLLHTESDQDKPSETKEELSTTVTPSSSADKADVNKEVTNYQSIEIDDHSKVQEEQPAENEEQNLTKDENMLTKDEAQELLLELSNPVEVAQFIVESDDARGFLQALRLLTDQDYISLKLAYYLRDRVMDELRRMLMIQEMELSRTLLNNYEPADFTPDQLPNDEPPAPYYDFKTYTANDDLYPQDTVPYEIYEESLRQENSIALADIAEAVAEKIANGELTPESGVKIMNTVASLLPDSYWEDALEMIADEKDDTYQLPYDDDESEYSVQSLGSDVIEIVGDSEERQDSSAELENELKDRNLRLENVLEKQLVDKAHITEDEDTTEDDEVTNVVDTSKEDALTDEDYQAFFDWLETEMQGLTPDEKENAEPVPAEEDNVNKTEETTDS